MNQQGTILSTKTPLQLALTLCGEWEELHVQPFRGHFAAIERQIDSLQSRTLDECVEPLEGFELRFLVASQDAGAPELDEEKRHWQVLDNAVDRLSLDSHRLAVGEVDTSILDSQQLAVGMAGPGPLFD